jgi:hypothetical protein
MINRGRAVTTGNSQVDGDPAVQAYLDFLAEQMQTQPHLIGGLCSLDRAEVLVEGVEVDPEEDLGDDATLD